MTLVLATVSGLALTYLVLLRALFGRALWHVVAVAAASSFYAAASARVRAWRRYRPGASPRWRVNARENEYSDR